MAEVTNSVDHVSKFVEVSKGSKGDGTRKPLLLVRLGQQVKGEAMVPSKESHTTFSHQPIKGSAQHVKEVEAKIKALDDELDEMKTTVDELTKSKGSHL